MDYYLRWCNWIHQSIVLKIGVKLAIKIKPGSLYQRNQAIIIIIIQEHMARWGHMYPLTGIVLHGEPFLICFS